MQLSERWSLWAGARHTRIERKSARTDGSSATGYPQSFTTPWLALSHALAADTHAYASVGQGIESDVVPNFDRYSNRGEALPALKSRQVEVGLKHATRVMDARLAMFDIRRPATGDFHSDDGAAAQDDCSDTDPCLRRSDGIANHRGIEAEAEWRGGDFSLRGSVMLLRARRSGSSNSTVNGLQPTNVPTRSLKLQAAYNVTAVPGLALIGFVTHEAGAWCCRTTPSPHPAGRESTSAPASRNAWASRRSSGVWASTTPPTAARGRKPPTSSATPTSTP
jgi:iron complex outermembrane recepter protein